MEKNFFKKQKKDKKLNLFENISEKILSCEILTYLKAKDILILSLVNKNVKRICELPILWLNLSIIKFSKENLKKLDFYICNQHNNWKKIYQRLIISSKIFINENERIINFLKEYQKIKNKDVLVISYFLEKVVKNKACVVMFQRLFGFSEESAKIMINRDSVIEEIELFQKLTKR